MKNVITYGTFDLFHIGHLNLLKRAKEFGDILIVAVSTDEFNALKGKKAIIPYEHRAKIVESIKYVDMVIPERSWEQKEEDIKKYNIDFLVMGNDWEGKFDHLKGLCEIIYLPRTVGVSTTDIVQQIANIDLESLRRALESLRKVDIQNLKVALDYLYSLYETLG